MKAGNGYTQIYTGDGKGKTTAATGLAARAAGAGLRVRILRFLKGRESSEERMLGLLPGVVQMNFGRRTFVRGVPGPRDRALARAGLDAVRAALTGGGCDLVIADEFNVAVALGLVAEAKALDLIASRPRGVELVLTGRGATRRMLRAADLVTEMKARKHYFARGVKARRGIEY